MKLGDGGLSAVSALDLDATLPMDSSTDLGSSISATSQGDHFLEAAPDSMNVVGGESLWHRLPQEILYLIMVRLPLANQRRLRCVCRTWEQLLSRVPYWAHVTPPCMIISSFGEQKKKFFCSLEAKWRTVPFRLHPSMSSEGNWEIVDTSEGLLLHECSIEERVQLCVCNLLTSSSRDISPKHPDGNGKFLSNFFKAKLLVGSASKAFKVVLVTEVRLPRIWTTKSQWDAYEVDSDTRAPLADFFVWNDVVFGCNIHDRHLEHSVVWLDMESGQWKRINAEFPISSDVRMALQALGGQLQPPHPNHIFLSDNKQARLFQFFSRRSTPFFIWELLDDKSSSDGPDFSLSNWKEVTVDIGLHKAIDGLVGDSSKLGAVKFAMGFIYFMFYSGNMDKDGVKLQTGLRHSLADGSWTMMPCPGIGGNFHKLNLWEPGVEIDKSLTN